MAILDRTGAYATGCNLWLHAPDFSGAVIPDISDSGSAHDATCTGAGVVGGVLRTETFDGQTVARSNGDMTATVPHNANYDFADGENFTIYMLYNHQESHFDWDFWFTKGFFPGVEVRVSGWNTDFEFSVGDSFGTVDGTRIRNTAGLVSVFITVDQINEEVKIYEGGGNDTTNLIGSFTYTQGSSSASTNDLAVMNEQGLAGSIHRFRDFAIWNNRILTEQEMNDLAANPDVAFDSGGGDISVGVSDSAAGLDSSVGVSALMSHSENMQSDDLLEGLAAEINSEDSVTGSDSFSAFISTIVPELASGLVSIDLKSLILINDAAAGSDLLSVLKDIIKTVADFATGQDLASSPKVSTSVIEAGLGQEITQISVSLSIPENLTSFDSISIIRENLIAIAETAQGLDNLNINVMLDLPDTVTAEIITGIDATLSIIEQTTGADAAVRFDPQSFIADIIFEFRARKMIAQFYQRKMNITLTSRHLNFSLVGQT